ncbi:MAG: hypothetical protein B7C55_09885 [Actinomycetales bacterium mxb001]|nr:MAG: hypothetical protein B7C55_09885 [Actinomycetales bacterium mxb001]
MRIEQLKESLPISSIARLYNIPIKNSSYNQPCPVCNGSSSFKVYNDVYYKCFKCGCRGDIFNLIVDLKIVESNREAIQNIGKLVDSTEETKRYSYTVKGMKEIFSLYHKEAKGKRDRITEYFRSRGWNKAIERGDFGFTDNEEYLQKKGYRTYELERLGLMKSNSKELFDDHVIFPVRSANGSIAHLQGRALNPESELRWLADKATPSISNYLYNLDKAVSSKHDYIVLVEGISDCTSLLELSEVDESPLPVVGTFGINTPLIRHAKELGRFNQLLAIFDRDKYPLGSNRAGEYKSWSQITPALCLLAIEAKLDIKTWMVPDASGIKDINDLLIDIDYDHGLLIELIRESVMDLHRMALKVFSKTKERANFQLLWALHKAVPNKEELDRLEEYVLKTFGSMREHIMWLMSAPDYSL